MDLVFCCLCGAEIEWKNVVVVRRARTRKEEEGDEEEDWRRRRSFATDADGEEKAKEVIQQPRQP